MIAGLLLFLVFPLVIGAVVYVLRRWTAVTALLSIGTTLALGVAIVILPLGRTVEVWGRQIVMGGSLSFLGRELILEEVDRIAIAFLYLTGSGTFLLASRMSPTSLLFPVGFGVLSLLSGSLLIRPLIYAVLLIEIAVAISLFALQKERGSPTLGGLKYLSFSLLAMPGLLVINWLMDRYGLTPDNTELRDAAAILMTVSFALLLGSVPFHWWMPSLAEDGEPLTASFVLTVNYGAVWFLFLGFLETYPELSAYGQFGSLTSGIGLAMVTIGGVLAAAQRSPGRILGYGALVDGGAALIGFGLSNQKGLALALLCLFARPFGLSLMAAGLKGWTRRGGKEWHGDEARDLARVAPWSTLSFVVGGLSTAGLPVTAGFGARWALYRGIGGSRPVSVLLMMMASGGLMIGMWRILSSVVAGADGPGTEGAKWEPAEGDRWLTAVVIVVAVAGCALVGIGPQLLAPTAARLASLYTFLAP